MDNMITTTQQGAVALRPIPEITISVKRHVANIGTDIIGLGLDLAEAKAQLDHGTWLPWLKTVGFGERTAENYIRVAQAQAADARLASLPYSKALALISAPAEDREQLLDDGVEDKSAAEVKRLVADLARERKEKQEAERSLSQKETYIGTLESNLRAQVAKNDAMHTEMLKLKDRPAEVREVEKVVTVQPADYQQTKRDLAQALDELKRMEAAPVAAEDTDSSADVLTLEQLVSACNTFYATCWHVPFMDTQLAAMSADRRQGFRVAIRGVMSLAQQMMQCIDRVDGVDVVEGGVVL